MVRFKMKKVRITAQISDLGVDASFSPPQLVWLPPGSPATTVGYCRPSVASPRGLHALTRGFGY